MLGFALKTGAQHGAASLSAANGTVSPIFRHCFCRISPSPFQIRADLSPTDGARAGHLQTVGARRLDAPPPNMLGPTSIRMPSPPPPPTPSPAPKKGGGVGMSPLVCCSRLQPAATIGQSPIPCPSLGPSPSIGGGAHRPLTAQCPPSPSWAHLSLSTSLSSPLGGCAGGGGGGCKLRPQKKCDAKKCKQTHLHRPPPSVKMGHVTQTCPWIATIKGD